ncbi:MAG: T9SS type A sorting domain-containing protein [Flavobacterium sp.]
MKKLILFCCFILTSSLCAQDFWTEFSTSQPTNATGVSSISIVSPTTTWLNMKCGTAGCSTIRRYAKTTNGGSVWTTGAIDLGPDSQNLEISTIHGVSESVAYASVFPKTIDVVGGVWKTVDGGESWTRQPSAAYNSSTSFVTAVYFWNANEGVAMGDQSDGYFEIYTTSDGGENWSRVPSSPSLIALAEDEYGIFNDFTVRGNVIWGYTTYGRILKSIDKGVTWTVVQSPVGVDFFNPLIIDVNSLNLSFTDENNGLLLTNDWRLFNTTDGGLTWSIVEWQGNMRNLNIAAVQGLANTYISIGEDLNFAERGSSYTIDNGLNWIDINNNPDVNYVDGGTIQMLNEDYGFASGFSTSPTEGGIFRWGGGPMLRQAFLSAATFSANQSLSAYPNPTTGDLAIQGKKISKIEVFDFIGKKILVENYDSLDLVKMELNQLNAGVYFLHVTHENGQFPLKVIKK